MLVHNSIYGFRGADFRNILQFEDAFPEVTTVVLDQNYRSTQTILDVANAVIANNAVRKPKNLWTDAGAATASSATTPRTRVTRPPRRLDGRQLHDDEAMNWREIAVLYRTNAQSRVVEEAIMRLGIPYKVVGGTRFYDRREVKDAMAYLRAVVNPADEVSVKRVLNVPKRASATPASPSSTRSPRREGIGFLEALRGPTRLASPGRRYVASRRSSRCSISSARWPATATRRRRPAAVLATSSRRRSTARATWLSWRPRTPSNPHGRLENLAELVGSAREFTHIDEFLEQVSLVADTDELETRTTRSC